MLKNIIASKAAAIKPSLTLSVTEKAKILKSLGVSIIGFGAGEPDLPTPKYIVDAAHEALEKNFTKYTPASGTAQLKNAIKAKLKKDNNLDYQANQIVISNGAKHSLYNAIFALIDSGDEVILPAPYWLTYPELVNLAGGKTVIIETTQQNGFKITPSQLESAITPKTKAFILNSPSNPTGAVYSKKELEELGKVLSGRDIYIISDEIYEKLVYGCEHVSIAQLGKELYDKTVLVNGLSKCYSMTGWRIGYIAAPAGIASAVSAVQSHMTSNPNSIAQYASEVALSSEEGYKFIDEMVGIFRQRRDYMVDKINSIKNLSCFKPDGAFYVMLNISQLRGKKTVKGETLGGSLDVTEKLLNYGVAAVPGIAFGADDYLRLSYAISLEDIKEGLNRIEKFANDIKE
jgi:aspartate aminotransferase